MKISSYLIILALMIGLLGGCANTPDTEPVTTKAPTPEENPIVTQNEEKVIPTNEVTTTPTEVATPTEEIKEDTVKTIDSLLSEMSLTEKVEQMLMPNFRYWGVDEDGNDLGLQEMPDEVKNFLQTHHFGGVILFADNINNIEQTVRLVDSMQTANAEGGKTGLFMALDQEGGLIIRLTMGTRLCGNMALGAAASDELTEKAAELIGNEVKAMGFNTDFAPVIDVNSNPSNPIIGVRSFSDDPELVGRMGVAYLKGLTNTGVVTTVKHFPGHGDTATDSHTGLPLVDKSLEELMNNELIPYQTVADSNVDMIMTAHIVFPQLEKETYISIEDGEEICLPATLSHTIITDILRNDMGYDGVVITDAMVMDAIDKNFEPMDSAKLAINAGVDMILIPKEPKCAEDLEELAEYIEGVVKLVESGEISEERINESVKRILKLKGKYGLLNPINPTEDETADHVKNALTIVGSKGNHELESEITSKTVTLVKNDGVLPLNTDQKIVIACWYNSQLKALEYAVKQLKKEGIIPEDTDITCFSYDEQPVSYALEQVEGADCVIAVTILSAEKYLNPFDCNNDGEPDETNWAACVDSMMEYVQGRGGKFVHISSRLPYDVARYSYANATLCCYNNTGMSKDPGDFSEPVPAYGPNVIEAIYAVFGKFSPSGKLPVDVPFIDAEYHYTDEIMYERGTGTEY